MVWFNQTFEREQQICIRNDHARIDAMCLSRVNRTGVYLHSTGAPVSDEYPIDTCARQDVAAVFFKAQGQLICESL
jgi:hypothetical protein